MRTEIFKRDDVFIRNKGENTSLLSFDEDIINTNEYDFYLKTARDRMLLVQADFAIVITNNHFGRVIKDRQNGGELSSYTITSEEYPELFI